jgi:hypothetical protein
MRKCMEEQARAKEAAAASPAADLIRKRADAASERSSDKIEVLAPVDFMKSSAAERREREEAAAAPALALIQAAHRQPVASSDVDFIRWYSGRAGR